jgi:peroxiredoxin
MQWKGIALFVYAATCAHWANAGNKVLQDPGPDQYMQRLSGIPGDTAKNNLIEVGDIAPLFSLADLKGRQIDLSAYKGKYLLLDFWASWCKPCRIQNPGLVRLYRKYRNPDFEVVGISIDTDRSAWYAAVKKDSLPWLNIADLTGKNDTVTRYINFLDNGQMAKAVPQNYLLDPAGKVIGKNLHGEELEATLKKLFKLKTDQE